MNDTVLRNAQIVTATDSFSGHVRLRNGVIIDLARGDTAVPAAQDLQGDHLLPGLVELHTDNLEKHMLPRPGVLWDAYSATVVHDAQCAAAGITTVLDAVMVGSRDLGGVRRAMQDTAIETLHRCRDDGVLRVEHLLHLRCEVATADVLHLFQQHIGRDDLRLISVMDHTAGQRQWRDLAKYRQYLERNGRFSEDQFSEMLDAQQREHQAYAARHRQAVIAGARERGIPVASHDDTEVAHVHEAQAEGITISEFPTTVHAARAAQAANMAIIMGGPNLVRGGSHSGNVAAAELAELGLLDILSSDYVPASLLMSVFALHQQQGWTLPRAVATASRTPARAIGLHDRGEIAPGQRADLTRVRWRSGHASVIQTWLQGRQVA